MLRSRLHQPLPWTRQPQKKNRISFMVLGLGLCAAALSACTISTTRDGWPGSYAPAGIPDAQNCVPFSFGQPTKFACKDGKVYTAHQLRELREKQAKGVVASSY